MEINQLIYFCAIVETGTYFEAAENFNISQSALSKNISRLEEELGVILFDRSKRRVTLTEIGQLVYQDCQNIITAYNATIQRVEEYKLEIHSTIRIASLPILSHYNITAKLKTFMEKYPHIKLIIDEVEDDAITKEVEKGNYDFMVARISCLDDPQKFRYYELATDRLVLVTPSNHPLVGRKSVSIRELIDEEFILMHKYISVHKLCINLCRQNGFSPKILRTARVESIIDAVENNEGISLLMNRNMSVFTHNNIAVIPLEELVHSTVILAILCKKKLNDFERLLIQELCS